MAVDIVALRKHYAIRIAELLGEPPRGDFSLSVQASGVLLEMLRRRRARSVLELGAGFSTLLLRTWSKGSAVDILTLEHDKDWRLLVRELLRTENLDARGVLSTDNIGKPKAAGPWDLILVDHGPTMQTRLRDLERLVPTMRKRGVIVLDDFRRRTNYAVQATKVLTSLGLEVTVPARSQSGDRAFGVGYFAK